MHERLRRQVERCGVSLEAVAPDVRKLLDVVGRTYEEADRDCALLERSVDLTSQELLEAIRSSEARFRRLFEGSRDTIYMSTPDGRLRDINPAGVELFGYASRREMLSVDIPHDIYVRPEDRDEFCAAMLRDGFVRDMEVSVYRRDGRILLVQMSASAERDARGEIVTYRGILRDVTARRDLEESLHRAQRMESIGRLAGGVAHDFNNLLTAILGYTELCDRLLPEGGPARPHLQEIVSAASRGAQLTSQLLAFSRHQVLTPRVLALNEVVQDMRRLLRRVIGEDVELVVELGEGLCNVRADGAQLEQVLLNLAVNARDALPEGGTLWVRTRNVHLGRTRDCRRLDLPPGRYVVLEAQDDGVGMTAEVRERVFEPFFTTKPRGKGTGLGLATVYGIVEQSGGRVELRSQPGRGSTFTVYLPATDEPVETVEPEEDSALTSNGTETILVVEDEESVRSLLCDVLTAGGFRVLTACDGREGLARLRELDGKVDLLMTDVVMPRMNGTELCQIARAQWPDLPILLVSGYTDEPDRVLGEGLPGAPVNFLQKPFSPQTLLARLRTILERPADVGTPEGVSAR